VAVTPIGRIEAAAGLRLIDAGGQPVVFTERAFDHFV
jgi:thiamine-monophosphate kinase